jgi:O-antigen/teichoic acid export membrane protein
MDSVSLRLLSAVGAVITPLLVAAFALASPDVTGVLLGWALASTIEAAAGMIFVVRRAPLRPIATAESPNLAIAAFYYADKAAKTIASSQGGLFIAGLHQSAGVLAPLAAAADFGTRAEALSFGATGGFLLPFAGRLAAERGRAGEASAFRETTRYLLLTFAPPMLLIAVAAPVVVPLLYGGYEDATALVQIFLVAQMLSGCMVAPAWNAAVVRGDVRAILALRAASAVALASLVFVSDSPQSAAIAVALVLVVAGLGMHVALERLTRPSGHWAAALRIVLALAIATAAAAATSVMVGGLGGVLAAGLSFVLLYAVSLRAVGAITVSDVPAISALPRPISRVLLRLVPGRGLGADEGILTDR